MTNTIDLDKLEQVAHAATPGEQWRMVEQSPATTGLRVDSGYQCFFNTSRPNDFCNKEVRANIAFIDSVKPDVVLELVRRLRAAEADAKRYRWLRSCGPEFDNLQILDMRGNIIPEALDKAIDAAQGASHD